MSLPASNAMAPAPVSQLGNWRCHPVAFGKYTHGGVLAVFGTEIPLQYPELITVQRFADSITIGVAQKPVVTVERGEHSVQQRPSWPSWPEAAYLGL